MAGHPVLVFDIGGTNVRGAVCDPGSGRPIETAWQIRRAIQVKWLR